MFDYCSPAGPFAASRKGGPRQRLGYRRFATAAEAVRFAVEVSRYAAVLDVVGILLKIEALPRHLAGVISRQTGSANVRPHGVDCACRGDAYVSHKRYTAITAASHASQVAIDILVGDSVEISVAFQ